MKDAAVSAHSGSADGGLMSEAAAWVARIQSAEATEPDFVQWEEWLAADAAHASAYDAAEEIWALTAQLKPTPWPSRDELAAQAEAEDSKGSASAGGAGSTRGARVSMAIAASLLLGSIASVWFVLHSRADVLETTTAEQRSVRLPDGSRVTLGAETRLIVEQQTDRRVVTLDRGEAYFEVAHEPARPFIVRVNDHEVVAVGTAFNIEAQDDRMTVTVTEGVVDLRTVESSMKTFVPGATIASPLRLAVGDRAAADRMGNRRLTGVAPPAAVTAWRDGRLEYLHESLRTVLSDVNRYTEHKVVVADDVVGTLQFTGTVLLDRVDVWLNALPGTFPVEIVEHDGRRFLQRASVAPVKPESVF